MTIVLKNLPKVSLNDIYAGIHWTKRKKLKEQYTWIIRSQFKGQLKKDKQYHVKYYFEFKRNPLDASNVSFMAKMIEDIIFEDDKYDIILSVQYFSKKGKEDNLKIDISYLESI